MEVPQNCAEEQHLPADFQVINMDFFFSHILTKYFSAKYPKTLSRLSSQNVKRTAERVDDDPAE